MAQAGDGAGNSLPPMAAGRGREVSILLPEGVGGRGVPDRDSELRRRLKEVQMMVNGSEPAFEVGLFQTKLDQVAEDDRFYPALVPFDSFDDVMRRDRYRPLPDDWIIAVTDVSHSTEAIEQG